MAIRHFEDAPQEVSEDLGAFMSRLRRLAGYAFAMEGEDSRRSRVIWKFVTGLQDECVRRDVIRHKWIGEEGLAKECDTIDSTGCSWSDSGDGNERPLRIYRERGPTDGGRPGFVEACRPRVTPRLGKRPSISSPATWQGYWQSSAVTAYTTVLVLFAGAPWRLSQLSSTRAGVPDLGSHTKTSSDVDVSSKS